MKPVIGGSDKKIILLGSRAASFVELATETPDFPGRPHGGCGFILSGCLGLVECCVAGRLVWKQGRGESQTDVLKLIEKE
jgi:hypothetical protein